MISLQPTNAHRGTVNTTGPPASAHRSPTDTAFAWPSEGQTPRGVTDRPPASRSSTSPYKDLGMHHEAHVETVAEWLERYFSFHKKASAGARSQTSKGARPPPPCVDPPQRKRLSLAELPCTTSHHAPPQLAANDAITGRANKATSSKRPNALIGRTLCTKSLVPVELDNTDIYDDCTISDFLTAKRRRVAHDASLRTQGIKTAAKPPPAVQPEVMLKPPPTPRQGRESAAESKESTRKPRPSPIAIRLPAVPAKTARVKTDGKGPAGQVGAKQPSRPAATDAALASSCTQAGGSPKRSTSPEAVACIDLTSDGEY